MLDLTANFLTAARRRGVKPIWLVELPGLYRFWATTDPEHTENAWRFGDGLIVGAGAVFGGTRPRSDLRLAAPGHFTGIRRALTESGNADRLSRTQVSLLNQDNYSAFVTAQQFDNARVRILLGFAGLDYGDYALLMGGRVDNYEMTWDAFSLDITDARYQLHRDLSARLGDVVFTGAPSSSRGRAVPMLIGRAEGHSLLQVEGDASGTLGFAVESFHTFCRLNEFQAGFPEAGTINLGVSETGVPYNGRRTVVIQGVTYLQLDNLERTAPNTHAVNTAVTLSSASYAYLVAYESGLVTAVYEDDVEVSAALYSVEYSANGADYPVTLVRFSSEPSGTLTADVDGMDADPPVSLSNGGFESGDLTSWTASAGATASASTSDPQDGTYHLDLAGGDDTWEDLYQEFATRRGRYYNVTLQYQDNDVGTNLLTNGGFETDATTGWTVEESEVHAAVVDLYTGVDGNPEFGLVPEGVQALSVRSDRTSSSFSYTFYQDVTTVVDEVYTFSFLHFGQTYAEIVPRRPRSTTFGLALAGGSGSSNHGAKAQASSGGRLYFWQRVGYALSTDDGSTVYHDTFERQTYGSQFLRIEPVFFTAVSTTTRVKLRVYSYSGSTFWPPLAVRLDKIHLEQTSEIKTSYSRVQIGSAGDPSSALDEELEPSYNWRGVTFSFQAPSNTTRLTLSSKWTGGVASSFFDDVEVEDSGRNPALVIADLIDRFLPAWGRDPASFDTAAGLLTGWLFQGVISSPGASKTLLENLAFECKSSVLEGANDKLKLVVDEPADEPVLEFTLDNIDENSLRVRGESLENIYTDFRLTFGPNEQLVSATPDGTTHPNLALDTQCAFAEGIYGARREYTRTLNYIVDVTTAHHLLAYLVQRYAQRQSICTFRTQDYEAVKLERGDTVALTHPRLMVGGRTQAKVLEHEVKPDGIHLTMRTWGISDLTLDEVPEVIPPMTQGLRLWLRADDLVGSYTNGDPVDSWTDNSLQDITFTASTTARPTFIAEGLNGHAVVRFDGSSDGMGIAPNPLADLHGAEGLTVFIVTTSNLETAGQSWLFAWAPPANGFRISKFNSSDNAIFFQMTNNSAGFVRGSTRIDDGAPHLVVCRFDGTAPPSAQIYLDGGLDDVAVSTSVPATLSMDSAALSLGAGTSGNRLDGDLAELMVYERAMSTAERKSIEHFLMTKYGLL